MFIFSIVGIHPLLSWILFSLGGDCPFLIITIGSPISPFFPVCFDSCPKLLKDHKLDFCVASGSASLVGVVEPNLIELPYLPSNIVSPS